MIVLAGGWMAAICLVDPPSGYWSCTTGCTFCTIELSPANKDKNFFYW